LQAFAFEASPAEDTVNIRLRGLQLACLLLPLLLGAPGWSQPDAAEEWKLKIMGLLRSHLNASPALSDRSGEAWVEFTIDRSGLVKSTKLARSSDIPEFDAAALAAVAAAQPFPVPPGVADSGLTIRVGFVFPSPSPADINSPSKADINEEKLRARVKGICRGC
jgi:TonB family protein